MATTVTTSSLGLTSGVSSEDAITVYPGMTLDLDSTTGIVIARYFQGDLQGTADYAERLTNARNIILQGHAKGSVSFDGSTSVTMDVTVDYADHARYATSTGRANNAQRASYADLANLANHAITADKTGYAEAAKNAENADHATEADTATQAQTATIAVTALAAIKARTAESAGRADFADHATSADTADKATEAGYATEATHAVSANRSLQTDWAATAGTAKLALKANADGDGNNIADTYVKKAEINEVSGAIRVISTDENIPLAQMKENIFYSLPITLRPSYTGDEGSEGGFNIVTSDSKVPVNTMVYNTLYAMPVTLRPDYTGEGGTQVQPAITVQDNVNPDELQDGQFVFTFDDTGDPFVDVDGDGIPD